VKRKFVPGTAESPSGETSGNQESSMKIQILGSGCPKCRMLEANARQAVNELSLQADIEKVTDIDRIMEMGVMMTPALAVDGVVKSSGKLLSASQIAEYLKGEN
jgi:small redox-active disulfide protein 2